MHSSTTPDSSIAYMSFDVIRENINPHEKGEFQICPRMDFDNILYVEYLRYNNYKNEISLLLEGC